MLLALTGGTRSAESMEGFGLFAALSESGSALADALSLARTIADNAPLAVQATKQIIQQSVDWDSDDAWDQQMPIAQNATNSADAAEGLKAFIEKRQPIWTGQ
jgi:enoyl-CoA hydratase/carnithine racemase